MKSILLVVTSLLLCFLGYAQSEKFNLPPGAKITPKTITDTDYSYKLNQLESAPSDFEEEYFFKNFNQEDLKEREALDEEYKRYCDEARSFYRALSNTVKHNFTVYEIWYIYQFDQDLKNQLLKIK